MGYAGVRVELVPAFAQRVVAIANEGDRGLIDLRHAKCTQGICNAEPNAPSFVFLGFTDRMIEILLA